MSNQKKRYLGFRLNPNDPYKITPQEVSEEVYFALGRPIWRHQKKMQAQGKCGLSDLNWLWKCDGDCELCEFQRNGDTYREGYRMPSPAPSPESIAVDRITLHKLLERLGELCPDAVSAGNIMVEQDTSQRKALE